MQARIKVRMFVLWCPAQADPPPKEQYGVSSVRISSESEEARVPDSPVSSIT
jgi:hypothetical protein